VIPFRYFPRQGSPSPLRCRSHCAIIADRTPHAEACRSACTSRRGASVVLKRDSLWQLFMAWLARVPHTISQAIVAKITASLPRLAIPSRVSFLRFHANNVRTDVAKRRETRPPIPAKQSDDRELPVSCIQAALSVNQMAIR